MTQRKSSQIKTIPLADVRFRADLYPRLATSPKTVQKYAETIDVLPPIHVNQHGDLIDGWHRWTAHKKIEAKEIVVEVVETSSDAHLLELAIGANAKHGLQLSQDDKREMARKIYAQTPERERADTKKRLQALLSVPERTLRDWLSRIDKDSKKRRDKSIIDQWMACRTQAEIAAAEGVDQTTVARVVGEAAKSPDRIKPYGRFEINPPQRQWAIESKKLCVISRELIIWRVG